MIDITMATWKVFSCDCRHSLELISVTQGIGSCVNTIQTPPWRSVLSDYLMTALEVLRSWALSSEWFFYDFSYVQMFNGVLNVWPKPSQTLRYQLLVSLISSLALLKTLLMPSVMFSRVSHLQSGVAASKSGSSACECVCHLMVLTLKRFERSEP